MYVCTYESTERMIFYILNRKCDLNLEYELLSLVMEDRLRPTLLTGVCENCSSFGTRMTLRRDHN